MTLTVEQAQAALNLAESDYDTEMQRDSDRGEGSVRTEQRRLERQELMRIKIAECKRDLEEAKRQDAGK